MEKREASDDETNLLSSRVDWFVVRHKLLFSVWQVKGWKNKDKVSLSVEPERGLSYTVIISELHLSVK